MALGESTVGLVVSDDASTLASSHPERFLVISVEGEVVKESRHDDILRLLNAPEGAAGAFLAEVGAGVLTFIDPRGSSSWKAELGHVTVDVGAGPSGVFALSSEGLLQYVSLDGVPGWRQQLPGRAVRIAAVTNEATYVVIRNGAGAGVSLLAIAPEDGGTLWTLTRSSIAELSGVALDGGWFVTTASVSVDAPVQVYGIDRNGDLRWQSSDRAVVLGPVHVGPKSVLTFSDLGNTASLELLDAHTGDRIWEAVVDGEPVSTPLVAGNLTVVVSTPPTGLPVVTALDLSTGQVRWSEALPVDSTAALASAGDAALVPLT